MTRLMDLVAGDAQEILLAIGTRRPGRRSTIGGGSPAHVALGGGLDPTWLDLFAEAARSVIGRDGPRTSSTPGSSSTDRARTRTGDRARRSRLDRRPSRASRSARSTRSPRAGSTWSRRSSASSPRDEKPWIRDLAGELVAFCRAADRAPDVLFAWSLR